jgi:release factor glutamine methyltransferase
LNNFQNIQVDFGEIKNENILQIKKNIKINNLEKKSFEIFQSYVFVKIQEKKYNFILANPPYIAKEKIGTSELQNSVLENEDPLALFAEDHGLYFVKKIILESQKYLEKNGEL